MKKRKILIISLVGVLLIIVLLLVYILKNKNKFVGTWTTDGITVYEFKKDYTGMLIVPLANYKFTYKVEDNKLYIDFENEASEDSEYEYLFEDDKLILNGDNGKYIFTKK